MILLIMKLMNIQIKIMKIKLNWKLILIMITKILKRKKNVVNLIQFFIIELCKKLINLKIKPKAGFWKCPYHNTRMCLQVLSLF